VVFCVLVPVALLRREVTVVLPVFPVLCWVLCGCTAAPVLLLLAAAAVRRRLSTRLSVFPLLCGLALLPTR
jgi:hypothetical protein